MKTSSYGVGRTLLLYTSFKRLQLVYHQHAYINIYIFIMRISSTPMINAELLGLPSIDRISFKTAENLPTNQGDLFACVCTSMEPKQNCL
jgi:hypothetical protein